MTRKEKIEQERKRQKELERVEALNQNRKKELTLTGDEKVLAGRQDVGAFDSIKKRTGVKTSGSNNTDTYKSGDKFYSTEDTSENMSKRDKRIANRQLAKEYRKNTRAEKLGKSKGLSDQQAKDFMQNRRDRFRQKGTNFVKGLTGQAMDTAVDDRLYRRDGSGTLQNMKTEDGKTYDATAPYKGSASKNFSDRGGTRDEVDKYFDVIQPKRETPPASEIKVPPAPEPEKVIQDETEKVNEKIVEGNKPLEKMDEYTFAGNVTPNRVVKDKVRTRAKGNFYDSAQTIDGFPDTPKATKFNIDVDKVDRKGLQDVIDEEKLKQLGLDSNFNKLPKKFNSQDILYNPNAG